MNKTKKKPKTEYPEERKESFLGFRSTPENRKFQALAFYEGWEKRKA